MIYPNTPTLIMTKYVMSNSIAHYLEQTVIPLRLGCVDLSGWSCVVSLWYLYENGLLYCATKDSAKVVEYLRKNPRCGFEVAGDMPPYCGVRGRATAEIIPEQGQAILEKLVVRYLGGTDTPLGQQLLANSENEVAIVLNPVQITHWNFSKRMKHENQSSSQKVCP